jgi:uncharacterized protein
VNRVPNIRKAFWEQTSAFVLLMLLVAGCRRDDERSGSKLAKAIEAIKTEEIADLLHKAEQGNVAAQYDLGHRYSLGRAVPVDYQTAANWLRKAAEQGHPGAQYEIGMMIINGHVSSDERWRVDEGEAAMWIRKAASHQHADAEFALGLLYDQGKLVPKDDVQAGRWILKAAEHGNIDAQHAAGNMFAQGLAGMKKDYTKAVEWWRKGAEGGNAKSHWK